MIDAPAQPQIAPDTGDPPRIGLIGDHDEAILAHRAIPLALASQARWRWLPTETLTDAAALRDCDGLWCVPGSPYRSVDGALLAIAHARTQAVPFLGTCGGFQHALLEHARNVLGWRDAEHAETAPEAPRAVIAPLACALVEVQAPIRLEPGTRLAAAYGTGEIVEGYHCSYGVNPRFQSALLGGGLRISARDAEGAVRGVELERHPFFVATLFQPERAALAGRRAPPVDALVAAARHNRGQRLPGAMSFVFRA